MRNPRMHKRRAGKRNVKPAKGARHKRIEIEDVVYEQVYIFVY